MGRSLSDGGSEPILGNGLDEGDRIARSAIGDRWPSFEPSRRVPRAPEAEKSHLIWSNFGAAATCPKSRAPSGPGFGFRTKVTAKGALPNIGRRPIIPHSADEARTLSPLISILV